MTNSLHGHNDSCVWVITGITKHDPKALFMYNRMMEDTKEELSLLPDGVLTNPYHEISDLRHAPTGTKPVRNCVIVCNFVCNFVLIIIGGQGSLKYDSLRQIDCPCVRARKQCYTYWSDSLHRELCQRVNLPRHVDCGRVIHDGASMYTYVHPCPCISIRTYLTATWSLCCIQWQVSSYMLDHLPPMWYPDNPFPVRKWCTARLLCSTKR